MIPEWTESIIRRHTAPLVPEPTGLSETLDATFPLRAVLWDIYGTLLISGVGDVGTSAAPAARAAEEALAACGAPASGQGDAIAETFRAVIAECHSDAHRRGIDFPEVVIEEIWEETLRRLRAKGTLAVDSGQVDSRRLSLEYEMRVNPVWPMPHAAETLRTLAASGLLLGIISNAQWFTPPIVEVVFGNSLEQLGISRESLRIYSYRFRRAKPSQVLFQAALDELAQESILPQEVMFIGNDLFNDCWGAARAGMHSALFAGDRRSLRLRKEMPELDGFRADWVVTDLSSFARACVESQRKG